ncbi:MAG: lipopolysaccharide biosynthesis protein [Candidatus Eisenbacteria bacterium]|uniref:Lipopolysaccharide biosynthesis protein n=1 Tax=Eiseniibacteriota bacterium TaxID=2212470 RepID=A0A7Y2E799_UNCEI|nr:lipopolysaccharide biosynthesis protein [Candidatus Eisenbacteria bacterium]
MSRIRANTVALGLSFFVTAIMAFVQVKILTNFLPESKFGAWVTLVGVGALLGTLSELGLPQVLIRYGAKYDAENRLKRLQSLHAFALRVYVASLIVLVCIVWLLGTKIAVWIGAEELNRTLIVLGYLAMASGTLRALNNGSFRSLRRMSYVAYLEIAFSLLVAFGYYVFRHRLDIETVFTIFIVCSLAVAMVGMIFLRRLLSGLPPEISKEKISLTKEVSGYWQGAAAAGIFLVAIEFFDKPLLASLVTFEMVAIFGVAARMALFPRRLLYVPLQVLNPEITHKWESGRRDELAQDLKLFIKLELALGLLLIVPLIIFARPLILLVSNADYLPAAQVVWVFAAVIPLLCMHQPMTLFLRAIGRVWLAFIADASWLLIYLGLGSAVVGRYGLPGFVAGQLVASAFVLTYTLLIFHGQGLKRPPISFYLFRGVLAGGVWGAAVFVARRIPADLPIWQMLLGGILIVVLANILFVLSGFLTRDDERRTVAMLAGKGTFGRIVEAMLSWPRRLVGQASVFALLFLPLILMGLSGCSESLPAGCSANDEVPDKFRQEVEAAAATLHDRIRAEDAAGIFENAAAPNREQLDIERFVGPIARLVAQFGLAEQVETQNLFVINLVPGAAIEFPIRCGEPGKETQLFLTRHPVQACLTQLGTVRGEEILYSSIWFLEDGKWMLGEFKAKPNKLDGKSGGDLIALADSQFGKGHMRNAALMYNAALDLYVPNPWSRPHTVDQIEAKQKRINVTHLPSDRLTTWDVDGNDFDVYRVAYAYNQDGFSLFVSFEIPPEEADSTLVRRDANQLSEWMIKEFPEYREIFRSVTTRASLRGDKTVGYQWVFPLPEESSE